MNTQSPFLYDLSRNIDTTTHQSVGFHREITHTYSVSPDHTQSLMSVSQLPNPIAHKSSSSFQTFLQCVHVFQTLLFVVLQIRVKGIKDYFTDPWNIFDQLMYSLLALAAVLRFMFKNSDLFEWARNVYAVGLILFCVRVLQLYLVLRELGPKIIMIGRMVGVAIVYISMSSLFSDYLRTIFHITMEV